MTPKGFRPPVITEIRKDSPAERAGIRVGDSLLSINGSRPSDVLEYLELADDSNLVLTLDGGKPRKVAVRKEPGEPLGLSFDRPIFGKTYGCRNRCDFCFVDQLPPGLRPELYFKDDDYRLSFLFGNFVTLTNMRPRDMRRILRSRLSPLYVSLQATDPELRNRIFGNRGAGRALRHLRALLDAGLEIHLQVVVCPGLNDGAALRRTLEDVEIEYSAAASVGLVPAGFTSRGPSMARVAETEARAVLDLVEEFQGRFAAATGRRMVHASDEIYLRAGVDFPPEKEYEGYPQWQNGIGMARKFIDEASRMRGPLARTAQDEVMAVTGRDGAPVLMQAMSAAGIDEDIAAASILTVTNRLFGPEVTVSGLVAGKAIEAAYRETGSKARILLIPSVMLSESDFIDGVRLRDLERDLGVSFRVIEIDGGTFIRALAERSEAA